MSTRTIDVILNMSPDQASLNKTKAGVKGLERALKDVETQANRTREKMEKLQQVGNRIALVGGAIVAFFALAMSKYISTAKEAEQKRVSAVETAIDKIKGLEAERLDVIKSVAEKIKGIDKDIYDKRISLAEMAVNAEKDLAQVRSSLRDTLRGIADSMEDEERSYARQLEDISLMGVELTKEQQQQMSLQRAKEDHAQKLKYFADQEREAKKKAAAEEKAIRDAALVEQKKIGIEIAKLEEQKRANKEIEKIQLDDIAKKERQANAERLAAENAKSKTVAGILAASERWEASQVRLGKIVTEVLLPYLEKALDIVDKITAIAEANPGAVKAALGIGGTLVVLGGMLSTAASIVSTIATVQGLAASLGMATAGSTVAGSMETDLTGALRLKVISGLTIFTLLKAILPNKRLGILGDK